jgi:IclR family KDG regulon transcriptional repressor
MIIDAIYLTPHNPADSALTIGNFNPIHCSATGKIAAAYHPSNKIADFLKRCPFNKHTDKTITSRKKFIDTLPEIRKRKIALTICERGNSVIATASPVFNASGDLAGIIGAQLPSKKNYDHNEIMKYASAVRETADAASFSLGFTEYDID